jgi:hypothetical protein
VKLGQDVLRLLKDEADEEDCEEAFGRMRVDGDDNQLVLSKRVSSGLDSNGKMRLTLMVDLPSSCNSTEKVSTRIEAGGQGA